MKVTLTKESEQIESGDILISYHGERKNVFIFGETSELVQVTNFQTGKVEYSIANVRGFNELVNHILSFLDERDPYDKYKIIKNSNIELIVTNPFEIPEVL